MTARTRIEGGWFGGDSIPDLPADTRVVSEEDLQVYAEALRRNSFYGPSSYYMNHTANAAYTSQAATDVLEMPVFFLHGRHDYVCETLTSSLAEPMREKCKNLNEAVVDSGHWMAQEAPDVVNIHLEEWLSRL
jgi:pimeloyl-ACP methyl ester carboxylesterase